MSTPGLVFDEKEHKYYFQGNLVPSVTQILSDVGLWPDYSQVDPFYADRGSKVHKAVELWEMHRLNMKTLDSRIEPYLNSYILWKEFVDYRPKELEKQRYNPTFNYAGTEDSNGEAGGNENFKFCSDLLVDLKCGPFNIFFGFQMAAYALMHDNPYGIKRVSLHLQGDGKMAKHRVHDDQKDFQIFKSAVVVYHAKRMF